MYLEVATHPQTLGQLGELLQLILADHRGSQGDEQKQLPHQACTVIRDHHSELLLLSRPWAEQF